MAYTKIKGLTDIRIYRNLCLCVYLPIDLIFACRFSAVLTRWRKVTQEGHAEVAPFEISKVA